MTRARKFKAGDTVVFTAAALKVRNWHGGPKRLTQGAWTVVEYPYDQQDDVRLNTGALWGDGWLESPTPDAHSQSQPLSAESDTTGATEATGATGDAQDVRGNG